MTVEQQLSEVKQKLDKVISRLDDLVVLEVRHDNTVESLIRCHTRMDKVEERIEELTREAAANTFITKIAERLGWIFISAVVGLVAFFLR